MNDPDYDYFSFANKKKKKNPFKLALFHHTFYTD